MKKIYSAVCIMLLSCMVLMAQSPSQQITAWQYYFNTDPGEGIAGNGAIVPITPAASVSQTLSITLHPSIATGFHQLYIRAKDEDNRWSIAERRALYVASITTTQPLNAMEYFFDNDPGEGNGTSLPVTPGTFITINPIITLPGLSTGFHQLYIRAKNTGGGWSISERRAFFVLSQTVSNNIVALQYYFDTDPGEGIAGNGAIVPVTPGTSVVTNTNFNVPSGLGCTPALYVRYKDSGGRWSIAERRTFDNPNTVPYAEFTANRTGNTFFFESEMANKQTHAWNYGDLSPLQTVAVNPSHVYSIPNDYNVCLTASNPACGSRIACHTVTFPGLAGFSPSRYAPVAGFVGDVSGGGFITGTTFKFIGVGADIIPTNTILGGTSRARLFCNFTGQPAGMRHLVVTIPGQPKDTLFDALNILSTYTASAGMRPSIEISGPAALWSGTDPEEFVVSLTNNTDETMYGVPVFIEIPPVDEKFLSQIIPDGSAYSAPEEVFIDKVDTATNTVTRKTAFLFVPYISPGRTQNIRFELSNPNPISSTIKAVAFPGMYSTPQVPGSPTFVCGNIPTLLNNWFNQLPPPSRYPGPYLPGCWMDGYIEILPFYPWGTGDDDEGGLANGGGYHIEDAHDLLFPYPLAEADFGNLPDIAYGPEDGGTGGTLYPGQWDFPTLPCIDCGDIKEKDFDVITSIDPNYKSGVGNITADNYVNGLSPLTYQVHFENLSSATAPASFVTITDNIDTSKFEMSTFTYKSFGFADFKRKPNIQATEFVNDVNMNPVKDVVVRNIGKLNPVTGLLDWKMNTYYDDTLDEVDNPLLGFLDPNITAPEGEGFIEFSLMPKQSLTTGTAIANEASITFDFNAPIITNTWINKIDKLKPLSNVAPMPATTNDSVINIIVNRSDANAGVLDYELYLKENSGPWKVKRYLTADTIRFAGTHGSTYQFYSIARDRVLNIEDAPITPDATTTLDTTRTLYYADGDGDGFGNALAPLLAYTIPAGYVTNNIDCNDTLNTAYPGAPEITCNGIDENCNGMADDGVSSIAATSATTDAANNEICAGASANLTVNGGTLGTGAAWNWYSGSCTGSLAGTGTTLNVSPASTTTYFVKAVGSCNSTTCVQVTLTVKTTGPASSVVVPITNLPTYACNGTSVSNVSVAAVPGSTQYIWDGPTGTLINGSNPYTSSSPSVNITFGNPNGSGYHIGVQAANSCGSTVRKSQWVRGIVSVPATVSPASGLVTHCENTTAAFSCPAVSGATQYLWTVTGNATVIGAGTTATVNFGPLWNGGTLCVAAQTPCYTSPVKCLQLTRHVNPTVLPVIGGVSVVCPGTVQTYTLSGISGANSSAYNWSLPANTSGTSSSNSINVNFLSGFTTGNICVTATSICGVVSAPRCKSIITGAPSRPASISGPASGQCGQTANYFCPPTSGASYNWTLSSGATGSSSTNFIAVTFPGIMTTGTVCVNAYNSCGTSSDRCITVKGAPNTPGTISALPSAWCAFDAGITFNSSLTGMSGVYSLDWKVIPSSAASYVSGQGTNSYITDWNSGNANVSITASNACGSSTRTFFAAVGCREAFKNSENDQASGLTIFPIPASQNVELELIAEKPQPVILVLYDNTGRLIMTKKIECTIGINNKTLDVSALPGGSYILNVRTASTVLNKKIIIEKNLTK